MKIKILVVLALAGILVVSGCVSDKVIDNEQKSSQSEIDAGTSGSGSSGSSTQFVSEDGIFSVEGKGIEAISLKPEEMPIYTSIALNKFYFVEKGTNNPKAYATAIISKKDISKIESLRIGEAVLTNFEIKSNQDVVWITAIARSSSDIRNSAITISTATLAKWPGAQDSITSSRISVTAQPNKKVIDTGFSASNEQWNIIKYIRITVS